jgi:D-glycero-alpha-D-manno-heptose 1-phosphate guanylyltransferase
MDFIFGDKVSLEDQIFPDAISSGQRLFGIPFAGTFIDIGIPADYYRASSLLCEK